MSNQLIQLTREPIALAASAVLGREVCISDLILLGVNQPNVQTDIVIRYLITSSDQAYANQLDFLDIWVISEARTEIAFFKLEKTLSGVVDKHDMLGNKIRRYYSARMTLSVDEQLIRATSLNQCAPNRYRNPTPLTWSKMPVLFNGITMDYSKPAYAQ